MKKGAEPLVSINIRTYNSAKNLEGTLQSVKGQSYKNIELVVSDGHSRDGSIEMAKKFGARLDYSDNLGDARHQNFRNSRGKYVFSVDSDQVIDPKLVEVCVQACEKDGYDALIISEKSIDNKNSNYLGRVLSYDKWLIDKSQDTDPNFGAACPRFYRREILEHVRWPKGLGIFDDTILYSQLLKNGVKVKYISNQSIRHDEMGSWIGLFKKFYRYGKSYYNTFRENPTIITAHSLPRRVYFSKLTLSQPKYFFGLILLYLVKSTAAGSGVVAYFLNRLAGKK